MFGFIKTVAKVIGKIRNFFRKYTEVREFLSGTAGFANVALTALFLVFTLFNPGPATPVGYDPPKVQFHAVSPCATCGLTTAHAFESVSETTIWRKCSNCDHSWEEQR
jgi:hypothetical protein